MRPLRFPALWFAVGLVLAGLIAWGSLSPPDALPKVRLSDKVQHVGAYVALTLWFAGLLARRRWVMLAAALIVFGLLIEVLQGAMPFGRTSDARDLLANGLGIAAGLGLARLGLEGWASTFERWIGRA